MKTPCEMKMWYILPGIRSKLAKELVREGLTQKEISKKMGITQASVSYYIHKKRGRKVKFNKIAIKEIRKLAKELSKRNIKDLNSRICNVCKKVKVK